MPDLVPVVPVDGAVAAVDPPADAAGDNNAQNANDNVVSVFSCPCIRFPSRVFRARRCWSFSLVLTSVISFSFRVCATSLVFTSVYKFTIFASVLLFSFQVCVTTLVLASVCKFSSRVCVQL